MHIAYSNGGPQKTKDYNNMAINKIYHVSINQYKLTASRAKFSVEVDGTPFWELDTEPITYTDVVYYQSDPWYPSLGGNIVVTDLTIYTGGF